VIDTTDDRPVGEDGSRPPLLDLGIRKKLMILALANILPIVVLTGLFIGWVTGSVSFSIDENKLMATVLVLLAALVTIALCWWVLFPFSKWLRAYPAWHFQHMNKVLWAVPLAGGYVAWFAMWVACVGLTLFAIWLILDNVWTLLSASGSV
jgi:magnesium-transporting ATPase (P-type)